MAISPVCQRDEPIRITVKWVDNSHPSIPVGHLFSMYKAVTRLLFKPRLRISFIHKLTTKMCIIFERSFLFNITTITKIFPSNPRSNAINIMPDPIYKTVEDGPVFGNVEFVTLYNMLSIFSVILYNVLSYMFNDNDDIFLKLYMQSYAST